MEARAPSSRGLRGLRGFLRSFLLRVVISTSAWLTKMPKRLKKLKWSTPQPKRQVTEKAVAAMGAAMGPAPAMVEAVTLPGEAAQPLCFFAGCRFQWV